jgi:hypothetical protein
MFNLTFVSVMPGHSTYVNRRATTAVSGSGVEADAATAPASCMQGF